MKNATSAAYPRSAEDEERAVEAALAADHTTDYVRQAERAIGRAFSLTTDEARPILVELLRRKQIETRPAAGSAIDRGESPEDESTVLAKWFRTHKLSR